jgi:hypothetical protein
LYSSLVSIDGNGPLWKTNFSNSELKTNEITEYSLSQNYPNPFNPNTRINFELPESGYVNLKVFNILGEMVSELVNRKLDKGSYSVDFSAQNLPSGLYIYKIECGSYSDVKKMILLK